MKIFEKVLRNKLNNYEGEELEELVYKVDEILPLTTNNQI